MKNRDAEWVAKALLITVAAMALGWCVASLAVARELTLLPTTTTDACTKCDRAYRRCQRDNCPTPTFAPPTPSPQPTIGTNCTDGTWGAGKELNSRVLTAQPFEPARVYHFCAPVPQPVAGKQGFGMTLQSHNYANTSCNNFSVQLVAPGGTTYPANGTQPGTGGSFEVGTWQVVATLLDDGALCKDERRLDMFLTWWTIP